MYTRPIRQVATIASGGTQTGVIRMTGGVMIGFQLPDAFDGTALTIQGAAAPTDDFENIYDSDGNQVSVVVAADRSVGLSAAEADAVAPWPFIKLTSNAMETGDRDIIVSTR